MSDVMDSQDVPATLLRLDERLALLEWPELSRIDENRNPFG